MKIRLAALALTGFVVAGMATAPATAATLTQRYEKTFPFQAGALLELDNTNGGVTVEPWNRNEVQIVAEKKVKAPSDEKARELMDKLQIATAPSGGGLRVETRFPKNGNGLFDWMSGNGTSINVNYTIRVPRQARLDLETTNGGLNVKGTRGAAALESTNGQVAVQDVEGNLKLETTNGGIHAVDIAGAVEASTTNGGIEVSLRDLPDNSKLDFSTTNGGVTVRLPRDVRLTLDAETTNGRISNDFELDSKRSGKHHLSGDINGGGGLLKVSTTNGSVTIEQLQ
ncbi:MAG TPA: DUF4097 family beta strand repeat-containing protein [Thermoanaerobaculia bacterium]|jgi:DUF4097 and DUF4098 domain-containing protein YvlB|nr:DUF4097 family beta strand repeat-containing protein [Thermoanaerobaculia bacterium]